MSYPYLEKILTTSVYDVARETPLEHMPTLSQRLGSSVLLKREDLQPVFSFKLRGAYNRISQLSAEGRERGVIAASAGNHAQGVALAASRLGIKAVIVMPVTTPRIKVDAVRRLGGKAVLHGDSFDEASSHAQMLQEKHGYVFIHPFSARGLASYGGLSIGAKASAVVQSLAATTRANARKSSRWREQTL
jgi:threonine dehydratase